MIISALFLFYTEQFTYAEELRTFTLEELAKYNGQNGAPSYVAFKGLVYDISNSSNWDQGIHIDDPACIAGIDVTDLVTQFAPSDHQDSSFWSIWPVVGRLVASAPSPTNAPTSNPIPTAVPTAPPTAAPKPTSVVTAKPSSGAPGGGQQKTTAPPQSSPSAPAPSATASSVPSATGIENIPSSSPTSVQTVPSQKPVRKIPVKLRILTRDQLISVGWFAFILFLVSCAYFPAKKVIMSVLKIGDHNVNSYMKKVFNTIKKWHCWVGLGSAIVAFIHSINSIYLIKFSASYVALFSLIALSITGFLLKYLHKNKHVRRSLLYVHIALIFIFFATMAYHLYDKLL